MPMLSSSLSLPVIDSVPQYATPQSPSAPRPSRYQEWKAAGDVAADNFGVVVFDSRYS